MTGSPAKLTASGNPPARRAGFTLIELLVVVAIISLLIAIILPSQRNARQQARIVRAHADLRQITIALEGYALDNRSKFPPTRSACGTDVNYQLPVELAEEKYLPVSPSKIPQAHFLDIFQPEHTYKYRAPGPIWFNGSLFDFPDSEWRPRAKIWVPKDLPHCKSPEGQYYANRDGEPRSPVDYAVWSVGPRPDSPKFPRFEGSESIDESRFPLPRAFWLARSGDTGLITHFRTHTGLIHMSP